AGPGVVAQYVQPARLLDCLADERTDRSFIGDVDQDARRPLGYPVGVEIRREHTGALIAELAGHLVADPGGRAGHDDRAARESTHARRSFLDGRRATARRMSWFRSPPAEAGGSTSRCVRIGVSSRP